MPLYLKLLHVAFSAELMAIMPVVLVLLFVGLVTAIFQSALQIEDTTFSLIPRLFAMIALGLFGGFGALQKFEDLAVLFISHAPGLVHQTWS